MTWLGPAWPAVHPRMCSNYLGFVENTWSSFSLRGWRLIQRISVSPFSFLTLWHRGIDQMQFEWDECHQCNVCGPGTPRSCNSSCPCSCCSCLYSSCSSCPSCPSCCSLTKKLRLMAKTKIKLQLKGSLSLSEPYLDFKGKSLHILMHVGSTVMCGDMPGPVSQW